MILERGVWVKPADIWVHFNIYIQHTFEQTLVKRIYI